jgi:HSP20 family molecular chaperone IbpA
MRSSLIRSDFPHLRDAFFSPVELAFDHFFDEFFSTPVLGFAKSNVHYPKMDIGVQGEEFVIRAAVPGVEPDALKVEVLPVSCPPPYYILRVSGEMASELRSEEDEGLYVKELCKRKFSREIPLPENVLNESPVAILKNGVLTLKWKLAKKEAIKEQVKRILIQSE